MIQTYLMVKIQLYFRPLLDSRWPGYGDWKGDRPRTGPADFLWPGPRYEASAGRQSYLRCGMPTPKRP